MPRMMPQRPTAVGCMRWLDRGSCLPIADPQSRDRRPDVSVAPRPIPGARWARLVTHGTETAGTEGLRNCSSEPTGR